MAEQLAFQKFRRQGGAGQNAEGPVRSRAPAVDGPGQDALARAALSPQQKGRIGGGRLAGQADGAPHGGVVAGKVRLEVRAPQVLPQGGHLLFQRAHLEDLVDGEFDLGGCEGFRDVVGCPPLDGLDGGVDRGVGRDDDDPKPGRGVQQGGDQVEPAGDAQTQIDEGDVEGAAGGLGQGVLGIAHRRHPVPFRLQADGQRLADVGLVVDDQDGEGGTLRLNHCHCSLRRRSLKAACPGPDAGYSITVPAGPSRIFAGRDYPGRGRFIGCCYRYLKDPFRFGTYRSC